MQLLKEVKRVVPCIAICVAIGNMLKIVKEVDLTLYAS